LGDFSLNIGIAQMSVADGFSDVAENDPESEDNDKDSFINSPKPTNEESLANLLMNLDNLNATCWNSRPSLILPP
jgi:hypothetical protein